MSVEYSSVGYSLTEELMVKFHELHEANAKYANATWKNKWDNKSCDWPTDDPDEGCELKSHCPRECNASHAVFLRYVLHHGSSQESHIIVSATSKAPLHKVVRGPVGSHPT